MKKEARLEETFRLLTVLYKHQTQRKRVNMLENFVILLRSIIPWKIIINIVLLYIHSFNGTIEKGSKNDGSGNDKKKAVAARMIKYRKNTTKQKPVKLDGSHERTTKIQEQIVTKKNSNSSCTDREYCDDLILDEKTCHGFKRLRDECPVSCHKCTPCKDDDKCNLYRDIKKICKYVAESRRLCPKTCGTCFGDQSKKIGDIFCYIFFT